jgi:hypothetical protein
MPEQERFAALYKKLMGRNFSPDPERSAAVLQALLQQLSADRLPGTAGSALAPPGGERQDARKEGDQPEADPFGISCCNPQK